MPQNSFVTLTDRDGTTALLAPELGGWLLRYSRTLPGYGPIEALHCAQEVIDRYPREMYAGNPILFPLVSFNRAAGRDHCYEWNGKLFEMPQHGFARKSKWSVVNQSATSVTMELLDNESTRANYPFSFRHQLSYWLSEGKLHWGQLIENRSAEPMPFSTGFHPYFTVPLTPKSDRSACFIEIPEATRLLSRENAACFSPEPFPAQKWNVQEDVSGTMFLTGLKKAELALVDPVSHLEIVFNFERAPQHRFVAIWAKTPAEPYYCLEPWTALPNSFSRRGDRELVVLESQKSFRAAMWLELRPNVEGR